METSTPAYDLENIANRIGISTNLFLEEDDCLGVIENLSRQFSFVEVELEGTFRDQTDNVNNYEIADEIRKIATKNNTIINIHAPYIRVDYIMGSEEAKEEGRQTILRSAEFSIRAGASSMTFHPGFRFPKYAEKDQRNEAIALIQELSYDLFHINKHRGANLSYCLENSGNERPFLTLSHEENDELFSTSPLLLTLDMAHAASYCDTPDQALKEITQFAKYTGNVHLADINFPKHMHLPLGEGDFDYHSMVIAVEKTGYKGPYIVEEIGAGYKGQAYLDGALQYRDQLKQRAAA